MIRRIDSVRHFEFERPRRGGMSYSLLFSLIFFVVMTAFLFEIGRISIRKSQMQIMADSLTRTACVLKARALNELTGMNHQIGEAMSFVVLHRALYGANASAEDLSADERAADHAVTADLERLDAALRALGAKAIDAEYLQPVRVGGAVGAAMIRARQQVRDLEARRLDSLRSSNPLGNPPFSSDESPRRIGLEWQALRAMERRAADSLRQRRKIETVLIPRIEANQDRIVRQYPQAIARCHEWLGKVDEPGRVAFVDSMGLPVEPERIEPEARGDGISMERSQIVRASYPWVVFDRRATIDKTAWMVMTRFAEAYRERTDRETIQACRDHVARGGRPMFVLSGRKPGMDKGHEDWRTDSAACDASFGVAGFEYRPSRAPIGAPVLRHENAAGLLTMAQGLTYAGSRAMTRSHPPGSQRPTAWDTLQWSFENDAFIPEFPAEPGSVVARPEIRLDWQARLVPLNSSIERSTERAPGPVAALLRRVLPVARSIRTL